MDLFTKALLQNWWLLLFVALAFAAQVILRGPLGKRLPRHYPYRARPLMTQTEIAFYHKLRTTYPDFHLNVQTRLADVAQVNPGLPASERQSYNNRILQKHIDYLICHPVTLKPLCAIELDDRSHRAAAAQFRDTVKDGVLKAARIPLVRLKPGETTRQHLRQSVTPHLQPPNRP